MLWTRLAASTSVKSTPTYVGMRATYPSVSGKNLTITYPVGTQQGDLLIAVVFGGGNNPNGWTQASWTWAINESNPPGLGIAYKIAAPGETSSTSVIFSTTNNANLCGIIMAFRGAAWGVTGTVNRNAYRALSITTADSDSILLGAWGLDISQSPPLSWISPSGMTEVVSYGGTTRPLFAVYRQNVGAGATGDRLAGTSTGSTSSNRQCVLFSIKPS